MKQFKVTIEGVTPILFNRFIEATIDVKGEKRPGEPKAIPPEYKLYRDGEGNICIPSTWINGSLIEASKNFKITGKGKATYSKLVGSMVKIYPDMCVVEPQKYDLYTVSAVNPSTKGRMMVTRPKMDKWKTSFNIEFNEDDISVEVLKNILDYAGQYVGIGDWRPAKKGQFGKFMVTKFEEVE